MLRNLFEHGRRVARVFGFALSALALVASANAADLSDTTQQMKIIAPFPAGGSADVFARILAEKVAKDTGRTIIVEPRPGAAGIIGTRMVIGAPPDGLTLVSTSVVSTLIAPKLVKPEPFDALKDLAPITPMANVPALLVVNPSLGIKSFDEFLAYAKKNPGKINVGNSGTGTLAHLATELLRRELNIKLVHVAYKGAPPAVADLLGGHVQAMFSDAAFFLEHIKAEKLIPLAVASKVRLASLPNVPTMAELGYPKIEAGNVYALLAPAGTPPAVIDQLSSMFLRGLSDPEIKKAYADRAAISIGMKPDEFKRLMGAEARKWIPLVDANSVK